MEFIREGLKPCVKSTQMGKNSYLYSSGLQFLNAWETVLGLALCYEEECWKKQLLRKQSFSA